MTQEQCPVCKKPSQEQIAANGSSYEYHCPQCGVFRITKPAILRLTNSNGVLSSRQMANLSGWLRENPQEIINGDDLDRLLHIPTPSVAERAEKLLVYLARENPDPGMEMVFPWNKSSNNKSNLLAEYIDKIRSDARIDHALFSVSWSESAKELLYLIEEYLTNTKHFLLKDNQRHKITPEGWAFLDDLRKTNKGSKMAFVAMNFDAAFTQLYDEGIAPAIGDAGYEPKRVDRHEHVNRIDDEIVALINRSKFIVADFTGQKGGVYFEAGYALGMRLKVIWSCREDERNSKHLHFDTAHFNMLGWTADNLQDYRTRLKTRIEAVICG